MSADSSFSLPSGDPAQWVEWLQAWLFGVPLIVLCVGVHVLGLLTLHTRLRTARDRGRLRSGMMASVLRFCGMMTVVTFLHTLESGIWAAAYTLTCALPSPERAMLYSVEALTAYGHESSELAGHWQMLGALEALNGVILFGLSTAYLFAALQESALFRRH